MTTNTSLLHKALENLHVAQQLRDQSTTPHPPSSTGSKRSQTRDRGHHRSSSTATSESGGESEEGDDRRLRDAGNDDDDNDDEDDDDDDEDGNEMVDVGKGTRPSTPPPEFGRIGQTLESRKSRLSGKGLKDPVSLTAPPARVRRGYSFVPTHMRGSVSHCHHRPVYDLLCLDETD